jgi:ABC-2 type transport system permease protein
VANLRRIGRLWLLYAWLDFAWVTRDLKTVLIYIVSDALVGVTAITGLLLLAERFGAIGVWSRDQIIFMLGYATLARGLIDVFFGYNVGFISRRVGRGQLDHALIQPQPVWLGLLTDGFNPISSSGELFPALALLLWSGRQLALTVTPGWLALFVGNLAASCAIILAYTFVWGSIAFWAPRAGEEINSSTNWMLEQLKSFPLDGLGSGLLGGLLSVIPAGFVAWLPSRALLGLDSHTYAVAVTPLAALAFVAVAIWLFRKGMTHYARTGSQRYLSMGHRS